MHLWLNVKAQGTQIFIQNIMRFEDSGLLGCEAMSLG